MRRPRSSLSGSRIAELLADWVETAGFPRLDRRHMRAPFARWLSVVPGWDELGVRDAMGHERVRDLRNLDRAGELFSRYGTELYLDQVLAKKHILRA